MLVAKLCPAFLTSDILRTTNSVGLSRASLTVCEDSCRVSVKGRVDQLVDATTCENIVLACAIIKHCIELEAFRSLTGQCENKVGVVDALYNSAIVTLQLMRLQRSASDSHFDPLPRTIYSCERAAIAHLAVNGITSSSSFSINERCRWFMGTLGCRGLGLAWGGKAFALLVCGLLAAST